MWSKAVARKTPPARQFMALSSCARRTCEMQAYPRVDNREFAKQRHSQIGKKTMRRVETRRIKQQAVFAPTAVPPFVEGDTVVFCKDTCEDITVERIGENTRCEKKVASSKNLRRQVRIRALVVRLQLKLTALAMRRMTIGPFM